MNPHPDRRQFLKTIALTGGGILASTSLPTLTVADAKVPPVVDTHLHCFAGTDDARFPYHRDAPYRPEKPATPDHLLDCMKQGGVDFAVVVHPEPYQDDHRYLDHCLTVGGAKLKGTCLFFTGRPDTASRMTALVKRHPEKIMAARIHAYAPERLPPFGKPELRDLWKIATDLGLAIQLHFEPRYAPGFEPLIQEFSSAKVIIDHLGRPFQGTPDEHAVVVRWSRFKNTVMKISSLPDARTYPHRDVTPVVKTLVAAFGPDRLIYGGGFSETATGDSYRAYRERLQAMLSDLPAADLAKVLGGTAGKLFGFPDAV